MDENTNKSGAAERPRHAPTARPGRGELRIGSAAGLVVMRDRSFATRRGAAAVPSLATTGDPTAGRPRPSTPTTRPRR